MADKKKKNTSPDSWSEMVFIKITLAMNKYSKVWSGKTTKIREQNGKNDGLRKQRKVKKRENKIDETGFTKLNQMGIRVIKLTLAAAK